MNHEDLLALGAPSRDVLATAPGCRNGAPTVKNAAYNFALWWGKIRTAGIGSEGKIVEGWAGDVGGAARWCLFANYGYPKHQPPNPAGGADIYYDAVQGPLPFSPICSAVVANAQDYAVGS